MRGLRAGSDKSVQADGPGLATLLDVPEAPQALQRLLIDLKIIPIALFPFKLASPPKPLGQAIDHQAGLGGILAEEVCFLLRIVLQGVELLFSCRRGDQLPLIFE